VSGRVSGRIAGCSTLSIVGCVDVRGDDLAVAATAVNGAADSVVAGVTSVGRPTAGAVAGAVSVAGAVAAGTVTGAVSAGCDEPAESSGAGAEGRARDGSNDNGST
jgi:hypothetical protein